MAGGGAEWIRDLGHQPTCSAVLDDLPTDELERLYSHEQGNKKRKTVITAIEQSLAPRQGT